MNTSTIKRLAFIKYLFQLGITQSMLHEPINATCILLYHDAVELFLQLTTEIKNVGKSQIEFMEYWEIISRELGKDTLPQKESMRRLNKSRVALKHHGTLPSKMDVESFSHSTREFFKTATSLVFDVEFSEVSLIDFVNDEKARQSLKDADVLLSEGNIKESIAKSALAFQMLIQAFEESKRTLYGSSPFHFGRSLEFLDSNIMGLGLGFGQQNQILASQDFQQKLGEFVDTVRESLESIQNAIRILAMGIEYPKYSRFALISPHMYRSSNGEYEIVRLQMDEMKITPDDAQFCIDFVIESALRLQEFDYEIELPDEIGV